MKDLLKPLPFSPKDPNVFEAFSSALRSTLRELARDPVVVGFKSIVAYRTGLNVEPNSDDLSSIERGIIATLSTWKEGGSDVLRLANKAVNDFVVHTALSIAAEFDKPGKYSHIHPGNILSTWSAFSSVSHWAR